MNLLDPDLTGELNTRDALRLLTAMAERLNAATDAVEGDLNEGDTSDDRR